MKKAVILINAYTASDTELNQPRRLKEELERLGVKTEIRRNACFAEAFEGDADFIVYLDKDKYCARLLEQKGVRLFNRAAAVEVCDDKMLTQIALGVPMPASDAAIGAPGRSGFLPDVPMPGTIAGTLCYTPAAPVRKEILDLVERRLGYPVVVKESYGSLGKGVFLAKSRAELEALAERVKLKPHFFQKFVGESYGRDVRVIVVGGKVIACMQRISDGDFRSNAELGGRGEKFTLSEDGEALCKRTAAALGLDYCGIDLLFGANGFLVCEVNSNAFFGTIERVTGVNVAGAYAKHMVWNIYGEKE